MLRRYLLLPAYHFDVTNVLSYPLTLAALLHRHLLLVVALSQQQHHSRLHVAIIGARGEAAMPAWLWREAFRVGTAPHEHRPWRLSLIGPMVPSLGHACRLIGSDGSVRRGPLPTTDHEAAQPKSTWRRVAFSTFPNSFLCLWLGGCSYPLDSLRACSVT